MKRIWDNIKFFIFNHPAQIGNNPPACKYCGSETNTRRQMGEFCACGVCEKKVFDKILKESV